MFCIYCGNKIAEDSQFCNSCGKKVNNIVVTNNIAQAPKIDPKVKKLDTILTLGVTMIFIAVFLMISELLEYFEIEGIYVFLILTIISIIINLIKDKENNILKIAKKVSVVASYILSFFALFIMLSTEIEIAIICTMLLSIINLFIIAKNKESEVKSVFSSILSNFLIISGISAVGLDTNITMLLIVLALGTMYLISLMLKFNKASHLAYSIIYYAITIPILIGCDIAETKNLLVMAIFVLAINLLNSFKCLKMQKNKVDYYLQPFIIFLFITSIIGSIDAELHYILYILFNLLGFYFVSMLCRNVCKNSSSKNIISCIFSSLLLVNAMFVSDIFVGNIYIGIYVGIISLALIIIGFNNNNYKALFTTGIVFTIINIVYQLRDQWSKIPFWLYLLVAGLSLVGFVTYKSLKDK